MARSVVRRYPHVLSPEPISSVEEPARIPVHPLRVRYCNIFRYLPRSRNCYRIVKCLWFRVLLRTTDEATRGRRVTPRDRQSASPQRVSRSRYFGSEYSLSTYRVSSLAELPEITISRLTWVKTFLLPFQSSRTATRRLLRILTPASIASIYRSM